MPDPVPIPARLADRPVLAGLAVPYITVQSGDGRAYMGQVHGRKMVECVVGALCQACGQDLGRPLVIFVAAEKVTGRFSAEPPLHPECAAYSAKACPMLAGQQTHYRRTTSPHLRAGCDKPGCDCNGWVATGAAHTDRAGQPAPVWVAVWVNDYAVAVNAAGEVQGVVWSGEPLRVRPVVPPAAVGAPTASGEAAASPPPGTPGPRRR